MDLQNELDRSRYTQNKLDYISDVEDCVEHNKDVPEEPTTHKVHSEDAGVQVDSILR